MKERGPVAEARPDLLTFRVHDAIAAIPEAAWNALRDEAATPFTDWRFLEALEHSGCTGKRSRWRPRHLTLYAGNRLIAAAPAYACLGSDGDFSQDWGWADAAERAGIRYYPKLSITVPFTPATGRRLLVSPDAGFEAAACARALVDGALGLCGEEGYSGLQILFALREEAELLAAAGMARRVSYQFHWRNAGYASTDEFLARFDSKKRNQLRRERAAPGKQGIAIRTVRGDEIGADPRVWAKAVFALHRATIDKLPWGRGWLNLPFYERVFSAMPEAVEVVEARRDGKLIAGAFNVASKSHLYGRYWGCHEEHPFLHFNVCLYHSIDECIKRGVSVFEGGAGGEHKLGRGFEPSETFSLHSYCDARLDEAVRRSLERENRALDASLAHFREETPVLKKPPLAHSPGQGTDDHS